MRLLLVPLARRTYGPRVLFPKGSLMRHAVLLVPGLMLAMALAADASAQQKVLSMDTASLGGDVVESGRKIFHGPGQCFACHGEKLTGGPVAPSLLGPKWRGIDGSFVGILHVVRGGSPNTAMVSHPGGIDDTQAILVANYIYAVSQGKAKP